VEHLIDMSLRTQTLTLLCLAWITPAAAQTPPPALATLGPPPGSAVPAFTAIDQDGRAHTLQSLLGPKGAMLVFSRSADW
jgi:hypothetical protein